LFFFTPPAPTAPYTLSLHDALPIYDPARGDLMASAGEEELPDGRKILEIDSRRAGGFPPKGRDSSRRDCPRRHERRVRRQARSPDRKSTRLNSSHVKISYAVFCLKK